MQEGVEVDIHSVLFLGSWVPANPFLFNYPLTNFL
jgi:hypothetical protein